MSSVRGYDNLYSDSVNDIALQNYNKGIAHRLRLQQAQMDQNLPFKEPKMLGGVRASNSILPGTTFEGPSTLAVGSGAFRRFTGAESPAQGGKVNRMNKANRWTGYAKDTVDDAFDIFDKAKARGAGKVNRMKKAEKWTGYAKDTVDDAFDIFDQAKSRGAGKVNRMKKAKKYTDFSKSLVGDAFEIADKAKAISGGVNRLKKAEKWTDYSKKLVGDIFDVADKAKARGGKVNRLKKAEQWTDYSKGVIGDAFDIFDKAKSKGGLVYSPALTDALDRNVGGCCGGAKPKRKPRFEKGSPEALAWGAKMKASRLARKQ
jgi:hypothetical protein